ncbi:glycosyltransferase family 2 protein [Marinobacter nauticus]|uniref:Glycosyl transferase, family 2 n=1 Tax=Marinobacter nauticus (strain ATCC 700491 / DSM 11845 / VT8) TaxID=351348 RepID=A1U157_MARN8|nr:glycosyltransferase [Marinobacter nauticus]ABM18726.1 glycosyl transferase, family 2 [Marinobacter nauticus VT8]
MELTSDKPLVSVITPAFNRVMLLQETLNSVISQKNCNFEYLIIDDGSTDGTWDWLQNLQDPRIRVMRHPNHENRGQAASINLGLKKAVGHYVVILDSDDLLAEGALEAHSRFLANNAEFAMVYGSGFAVDNNLDPIYPLFRNNHVEKSDPNNLLLDCYIPSPGLCMFRKAVVDKIGFLEESFRAAQDHDFVLRIAEAFPIAYSGYHSFYYRKHENSISQKGLEKRWSTGFEILNRAEARFPYRRSTIRKRRALLHFRMGQVYWKQGNVGRSAIHILLAGFGDPVRAVNVILGVEKPN